MKKEIKKYISVLLVVATLLPVSSCVSKSNNIIEKPEQKELGETDHAENEKTIELQDIDSLDKLLANLPEYNGENYAILNNDHPFFLKEEKETTEHFAQYNDLDELGRANLAYALITPETTAKEERSSNISEIKPSGWQTINTKSKWGIVFEDDSFYLYNRCHLIAYCLTALQDPNNPNLINNLITGTRYMNINMSLLEQEVAKYVNVSTKPVLYRVTPIFVTDELIARGVLIEAYSTENRGKTIQYCRYYYNVQPGFEINYKTGDVTKQ